MGNSLNKAVLNNIEVIAEIVKPTILERFQLAHTMLMTKYNSTGNYTNAVKMAIIKQEVEISQIIGIINYMDDSLLLKSLNIK